MTGRRAAERQENRAHISAGRKAEGRYWNFPGGLGARAAELLPSVEMIDSNDYNAMRHLAAGYEDRANERLRRSTSLI
jgi:hypothetical protein